jgi:predicted permease
MLSRLNEVFNSVLPILVGIAIGYGWGANTKESSTEGKDG